MYWRISLALKALKKNYSWRKIRKLDRGHASRLAQMNCSHCTVRSNLKKVTTDVESLPYAVLDFACLQIMEWSPHFTPRVQVGNQCKAKVPIIQLWRAWRAPIDEFFFFWVETSITTLILCPNNVEIKMYNCVN